MNAPAIWSSCLAPPRREAPTHARLGRGEGGVAQACLLKCEQLTTLPRDELDANPLGSVLSGSRLREIERAVLRAIGVVA